MKQIILYIFSFILMLLSFTVLDAQVIESDNQNTLYDIPPRRLVDLPTAGTLPRGHYDIGMRVYYNGGGLGYINIGLSNRFMMGISYGAEGVFSNTEPNWNNRIGFSLKFRLVDELEYFPAITVGYTDQGYGPWSDEANRYVFKSRGFFGVVSRSFYFYKWTAGWHGGVNYCMEDEIYEDDNFDVFVGFDATFNYNMALLLEYDFAINDNKSQPSLSGKGRGYLNFAVKWLFTDNLEIELIAKDLMINRPEADTFAREIRLTYIDSF
ncbi:MAG: hypothetical protein ACOYVF_05790 [Candidatus Zixiibacteriota bacterium]